MGDINMSPTLSTEGRHDNVVFTKISKFMNNYVFRKERSVTGGYVLFHGENVI